MMLKGTLAVLVCLTAAVFAQDRAAPLMEAKLYVDDARDLERLGGLASDLYVCSRGVDERGSYLLLVTNAAELERIDACGLETRVTWLDLDDKFELFTGIDPDEPPTLQDFGYYFTYWEMRDSVAVLAANYPDLCSLFVAGVTSQGRDILCLKVSDNAAVEEDEPACFFTGATHGQEPMGTSIVMAFLEEILSGYGTDPVSTWLVDNREIYTVPILNPDCSVFQSDSAGANFYWRKNRRVVQAPYIGVDPARNYAYKWGYDDVGSSPNPQSHAYRGPHAWSDAEASAALGLQSTHQFRTEQNFHTFGGINCYPWSWTYASPPEQALLQEVVDTFQMYNGYHDTLTGQASQVLYAANGTQLDWGFADTAGKFISYSFVIEADSWFWACWNDSARHQRECDWNVPTLFYLARIAGVYFDPAVVTVDDSAQGNSSGRLDPGETADVWFIIRNRAIHPLDSAYAISAKLVPEDTSVAVLDMTFEDAGNTITMPVAFEVVLGGDSVGVSEGGTARRGPARSMATVVGSVLQMPPFSPSQSPPVLLDALGREQMVLRPGANDVSRLAPGVYFIREVAARRVGKVVIR
jgi:hypothetical protein